MSEWTKEELAARLHGREYREEITIDESRAAKAAGLLVAFGASDDLLEVRGVANEEVGAWEGGAYALAATGRFIEDRDDHDDLVNAGWTPPIAVLTLTAEWCPEGFDGSWRITASAPFASFDIIEDGELFCRGCVVDFRALASAMEAAEGGRDAKRLDPKDDSAVGEAETP
jgi:hypothetical protein